MTVRILATKGFTAWKLVAFMAFIAAMGILAGIAIPLYTQYLSGPRVKHIPRPPDHVDKALRDMAWGTIAFNNPEVLGYGQTAVVQLVLSGKVAEDKLLSLVTEDGRKESYEVQFTNNMEARLAGSAFEITPITPELQAVSHAGVTEWKWAIRAKELGTQKLFLTLNAHLIINGAIMQHTVQTFNQELSVKVVWPQSAVYFLWSHWQWICTAIAIPLLGKLASGLWRQKRRRLLDRTND